MNGEIFNIQRFCISDGPGIRTNVFLKGCPLNCVWCHNPESQSKDSEVMFYKNNCLACGKCIYLCKNNCHMFEDGVHVFNRKNCVKCFKCTSTDCPALKKVGQSVSVAYVITEVLKDKHFYINSGGGITLSGGEPLFQFDFSLDILKKAKKHGLHTAIETSGFAPTKHIKQIAEYTDLFLYDYKETSPHLHKTFTGVDNLIILENLTYLNDIKKDIILRCPIIPGYNDRKDHFEGICNISNKLNNILRVELEPYHSFGINKYAALSRTEKEISLPDDKEKQFYIFEISKNTNKPVKLVF